MKNPEEQEEEIELDKDGKPKKKGRKFKCPCTCGSLRPSGMCERIILFFMATACCKKLCEKK